MVGKGVDNGVLGGYSARMTISAIPTQYAGVNFRSRLEARWAAMFDLLGWTWEYESVDLDGYIPDFRLGCGAILAEVKPVNFNTPGYDYSQDSDWDKLRHAKHESPIRLCLGDGLFGSSNACVLFGFVSDHHPDRPLCLVGAAQLSTGRFVLRQVRESPPETDMDLLTLQTLQWPANNVNLLPVWREAGNKVQWRSVANKVNAAPRTEKQKFEALGLDKAPVLPAYQPKIPANIEVMSALKSVQHKRSRDAAKIMDKELISQVLDKKYLEDNELLATQALLRNCPPGTSVDQVVSLLMGCRMTEDRAREVVKLAQTPAAIVPAEPSSDLVRRALKLELEMDPDTGGVKNTPRNLHKILTNLSECDVAEIAELVKDT